MDVYADLLFLINFFMDLACLTIAAKIGSFSGKRYRICLAAAVGGVYSICALFLPDGIASVFLSLAFCAVISFTAFFRKGDRMIRMLRISLVYLGVNTAVGGGVSVAFYFIHRFLDVVDDGWKAQPSASLSPGIYLALALGAFLSYAALTVIKRSRIDRAERIRISAFGKSAELLLLIDSGNKLRDPLRGKACTVISQNDIALMIGEEKAHMLSRGMIGSWDGIKICAVPVITVNGSSVVFGFVPDSAELLDGSGKTVKSVDTVILISTEVGFEGGKAVFPAELI